jgi:hypothetical protein
MEIEFVPVAKACVAGDIAVAAVKSKERDRSNFRMTLLLHLNEHSEDRHQVSLDNKQQ